MRLTALAALAVLVLTLPAAASETPATEYQPLHHREYIAPSRPMLSDPTPIWEHLAQLTPPERANAVIRFDVSSGLAREIEQLWNSGQCDQALALMPRLDPQDIGVSWREPARTAATDWNEPVQVSTRDSVYEVELVADTATGNLFAFLLFSGDDHTSTFSCNISTDGGATWSETDDFWANYDIPSIGAVAVGGHAYIGFNRSGFAYISLTRYQAANGQLDTFPSGTSYFEVANGPSGTFEEVTLASNYTATYDRIYVFYNTTADSSRIVGFATDDFDTFNFLGEPEDVERGLDIEWNDYPISHPLVFSFINSSSFIRIWGCNLAASCDTLFNTSHAANGPYSALAVWKDTIHVVFDQSRSAVTQVRYLVSWDGGGTWYQGGLGDTVLGFSRNGAAVGTHGDGVGVTYWQYPQGSPGQAYRHRDYYGAWDPAVSIQTGNTRSDLIPAIERVAPHAFGALFYRFSRSVAYFNRSDWTGVTEPGKPQPKVERRAPTVIRGMLAVAGSEPALLLDASGRKVADLKPGTNDLRRLAPGVYFIHKAADGSAPHKVILSR